MDGIYSPNLVDLSEWEDKNAKDVNKHQSSTNIVGTTSLFWEVEQVKYEISKCINSELVFPLAQELPCI